MKERKKERRERTMCFEFFFLRAKYTNYKKQKKEERKKTRKVVVENIDQLYFRTNKSHFIAEKRTKKGKTTTTISLYLKCQGYYRCSCCCGCAEGNCRKSH